MNLKRTALRAGVLAAAFAGLVGLSTTGASAALLDCTATSGGGQNQKEVFYQLSSATAVECFSSQNPPGGGQGFSWMGMDYILGDKAGEDAGEGDGKVFFSEFTDANNPPGPGDWEVGLDLDADEMLASLVIILKQANSYAAFLIEDGVLGGTWFTDDEEDGPMIISHAAAWYKTKPIDGNGTTVIPLPASLPLFLAGLAGIGLLTRRRRAA